MTKIRLLTPYILFLALALFWSFSFLAIRISIAFFSPVFGATLRVGVAFFALSVLFVFTKTSLTQPWRITLLLWLQGILGQAFPFLFLFWGEQYISPGLASILNATVPLWTLLISLLILRDKKSLTLKKILGLILGFTGIITIFAPMILTGTAKTSAMTLIGVLSLLAMAISYASAAILYQKLCQQKALEFKASVWHQHVGSFVFLLIFSFFTDSWPVASIWSTFSFDALLATIYLGLFSTALAYLIYSYLISQWGAVRAVSVVYVVPVFSVLWDFLFLHIHLRFYALTGMLIILLGVIFVQLPEDKP